MQNSVRFAAVALAAALLAGCGSVVGSFIQPQTIGNPAGLKGRALASSGPLRVQTVGGSLAYSTAEAGASTTRFTRAACPLAFARAP